MPRNLPRTFEQFRKEDQMLKNKQCKKNPRKYTHSGKVRIESKHGLELGTLETGEIFGEVGHIIESPRTVTAVAVTNCLIKVIDEKTVKEKMNQADPVLSAIIRGLSLRIGDANALAEKHWLELSLYKSLGK